MFFDFLLNDCSGLDPAFKVFVFADYQAFWAVLQTTQLRIKSRDVNVCFCF